MISSSSEMNDENDEIILITITFVIKPTSVWYRIRNLWPATEYPVDVFFGFTRSSLQSEVVKYSELKGMLSYPSECTYKPFNLFSHVPTKYHQMYQLCRKWQYPQTLLASSKDKWMDLFCRGRSFFSTNQQQLIFEEHHFIILLLNQFFKIADPDSDISFELTNLNQFYLNFLRLFNPILIIQKEKEEV